MTTGYAPIVVLAILAGAFAVLSLMASALVRPRRPLPAKEAPYECGIEPVRLPKSEQFPVKFYVVAMLFIIFDIETIFLYPWAVTFRQLGLFGLVEMAIFLGLVFIAYAYIWRKGGLEWEEQRAERPAGDLHATDVPGPVAGPRNQPQEQPQSQPMSQPITQPVPAQEPTIGAARAR
jgi:NADH-quinone oxidoreductase subunit A